MDKKIVKALFSEIASKETIRPLMMGVHFEEKWCVATDTRVLVIYNESDPRFVGKTIGADGQEIKGQYPDVARVIPKANVAPFNGDLGQLYRALQWWSREKDSNPDDHVVIGDHTFSIATLKRLLSMLALTSEFRTAKFYLGEQARPGKVITDTFTGIVMPCTPTPIALVDDVRTTESAVTVSYANLINTFALESSKPKEVTPSAFGWLD